MALRRLKGFVIHFLRSLIENIFTVTYELYWVTVVKVICELASFEVARVLGPLIRMF